MRARNAAYSTRDNAYRVMFVKSSSSLKNTRVRDTGRQRRCLVVSSDWADLFCPIFDIILLLDYLWSDNFIHLERLNTG